MEWGGLTVNGRDESGTVTVCEAQPEGVGHVCLGPVWIVDQLDGITEDGRDLLCMGAGDNDDVGADGLQGLYVGVDQELVAPLQECFRLSHPCGTPSGEDDAEVNKWVTVHSSMLPHRFEGGTSALDVAGMVWV